jgi:nucleoside-diphosphate-sugar epimerase
MNPTSLYAQTKAVADNETLKYGGVALRFATAFGLSPRMRLDLLVNYIVYEAVRHARFPIFQSSARRSFIHCVDVARAIQFSLENYDRMKSQAYNVGSRNLNYTKKELADKVREQYSFQLVEVGQGSDEDSRDYIVSFEKLNKLGFNTTITIENGIGELLKIMPSFREEGRFQNP